MTPIYHITHLRNIPLILEQGELCANSVRIARGIQHVSIAHASIQDRRATTLVPLPPGGILHDYVPFYFAPRSPMLNAIHHGKVEGYTEGQNPVLHLVVGAEAVAQSGQPFVFTDGHAIMLLSQFYNDLNDLDEIDWGIMRAKYWRDTTEDNDRVRRRNAEFLVYQFVRWELIQEIGVIDKKTGITVAELLKKHRHQPVVKIHKEWYY